MGGPGAQTGRGWVCSPGEEVCRRAVWLRQFESSRRPESRHAIGRAPVLCITPWHPAYFIPSSLCLLIHTHRWILNACFVCGPVVGALAQLQTWTHVFCPHGADEGVSASRLGSA